MDGTLINCRYFPNNVGTHLQLSILRQITGKWNCLSFNSEPCPESNTLTTRPRPLPQVERALWWIRRNLKNVIRQYHPLRYGNRKHLDPISILIRKTKRKIRWNKTVLISKEILWKYRNVKLRYDLSDSWTCFSECQWLRGNGWLPCLPCSRIPHCQVLQNQGVRCQTEL